MKTNNAFWYMLFIFLSCFSPVYAEKYELVRTSGIVENTLVREALVDEMIRPVSEMKRHEDYYSYHGADHKVLFKTLFKDDAVYFLFINETNNEYPEAGKGNFLIKRNMTTGRFEFIKIFYRDEDYCYLEILPQGNRSLMNVYLFRKKLYHGLSIPIPIEGIIKVSFAQIIELTNGVIEWETLLFHGERETNERMAEYLREIENELVTVREAYDGALDRNGKYVAIENGLLMTDKKGLNCSGFMKWLMDGFYAPLTGSLMDIERLKSKHFDARGTRWTERSEAKHDPFFGLDWTRNIAALLWGAQEGREISDIESYDVRSVPFFTYIEDTGYRLADIRLILFFLAVQEPGTVYLGAINNIYSQKPLYVEYFHVVTFFPYFDKVGNFQVVVLDQHKEPKLESLLQKYPNQYIHLVRVRAKDNFSLFRIE